MATLARRMYGTIETALWASLAAFVIYFCAFVAPGLPGTRARYEALRTLEIAAEDRQYCAKWGMISATRTADQCISELEEFRAKVLQRNFEESLF